MQLVELLRELSKLDVSLEVVDNQLEISAPEEADFSAMIPAIRANKAALISYLRANGQAGAAVIPQVPQQDSYAATPGQQATLLATRFRNPKAPIAFVFNMSKSVVLSDLDIPLVYASFADLVARYEVLRTHYRLIGTAVRQVILAPGEQELAIEYTDISSEAAPEQKMEEIMAEKVLFDFEQGPLYRVRLLKLDEARHLLNFVIHHSISDKTSLDIIEQDLMEIYLRKLQQDPRPLPALSLQFKDYVAWAEKVLSREDVLSHKAFWREKLSDLPAVTIETALAKQVDKNNLLGYREKLRKELLESDDYLPLSDEQIGMLYGIVGLVTFRKGNAYHVDLGQERTEAVRALAKAAGVTESVVMLSLLHRLLSQVTGADDHLFALNTTLRHQEQVEQLAGFLTNTVFLRSRLSPELNTMQRIAAINHSMIETQDYSLLPVEQLLDMLDVPLHRIGKVFVNLVNMQSNHFEEGDLVTGHQQHCTYPYFDVDFNINLYADRITIVCNYVRKSYTREVIEGLFGQLALIIDEAAQEARLPVPKV